MYLVAKPYTMTTSLKRKLTLLLTVVLSLWMIAAGSGKVMVGDETIQAFHQWRFPRWLIVPVGVAEVAAAIGIFIPKLRAWALAGIVVLMAGAMVAHVNAGEYFALFAPLGVMGLVVTITKFRSDLARAARSGQGSASA